jgi:hypothetical protein
MLAKGRDWAQMGRAGGGYQPLETLNQRATRYMSIHYLVGFAVFLAVISDGMRCQIQSSKCLYYAGAPLRSLVRLPYRKKQVDMD